MLEKLKKTNFKTISKEDFEKIYKEILDKNDLRAYCFILDLLEFESKYVLLSFIEDVFLPVIDNFEKNEKNIELLRKYDIEMNKFTNNIKLSSKSGKTLDYNNSKLFGDCEIYFDFNYNKYVEKFGV